MVRKSIPLPELVPALKGRDKIIRRYAATIRLANGHSL